MPLNNHADESCDQSVIDGRPTSVAHLFRDRVRNDGDGAAYQYFLDDELQHVSWAQAGDVVFRWAAGLIALGVNAQDRVALASNTRYEWVLADLAIMCAGAATTTVYPTTQPEGVAYLVGDSDSVVVFAEDAAQVDKLRRCREQLPNVHKVVAFEDGAADGDWVIDTKELARLGEERLAGQADVVDERIDAITKDHLAVLIYTSGTTGRPKGAELTHDALVYEGASIASLNIFDENDLQFLWLPLSHVFGKVLLAISMQVGHPTAVDGRMDKIVDHLAVIRPTWMGAAPRIFEKARAKIQLVLAEESGVKAKLISWAFKTGRKKTLLAEEGRTPTGALAVQLKLADKLVFTKIRERFGGRIRFFISGSAALDMEVGRWFHDAGLLILEGYGLSETAAATCVNRPWTGSYTFGSIGWPVPGTEVKVAADGELLIRGPGVMRGYHNKPQETAEVLEAGGWFHSGDIAEIDGNGFVRITDRKKDLFKTSGGKYIAPGQVEATVKGACPYMSQFVVVGDGRPFASALVALDPEAIMSWTEANGLSGKDYQAVVTSDAVRQLVQGYIDDLNVGLNRWETIKKFTILDREMTVEEDELTPSLKVRRHVVNMHYSQQIERMYAD